MNPHSLGDLDISVDSTYYEIEITDADENQAIIVAKSLDKKQKLKSYAEAVSDSGNYTFERISCETKKPSTTINAPILSSSGWDCGTGSILRE